MINSNQRAPQRPPVENLIMDDIFMDQEERSRAQSYYQQVQQEAELNMCKFCNKQINDIEKRNNNVTMLQSSDCFHQCHIDCLREEAVNQMSNSQSVKCPRCKENIQQWELNTMLSEEEKKTIEKNQILSIVKENPNFVSCHCGNIMEFVPGQIVKGQKDDRGNPMTHEAAQHMANFRIRCLECNKNFCTQCNAEPYHTGKTCSDFNAKSCRYCADKLTQPSPSMKPAFREVCRKADCFGLMQQSCDKMLPCGHPCFGSNGEAKCMPCLDPECIEKMDPRVAPRENKDDFCNICYCSGLGQEPCLSLGCGHVYHVSCLKQRIQKQWNGPRIVFNYLDCPQCKQEIEAPHCEQINSILKKERQLQAVVVKKVMERAKFEDLHKDERLKKVGDPFYNDLKGYALKKLSYYQCFKCQDAYFGGMKDCEAAQDEAQSFKKEELVCGKCAAVAVGGGVKQCPKHGQDFIEFKCKFCCSIAQWFCWGNTHFCEPCHKKQCN
mmetsp:Transcript_11811/g.19957  ORF Transcript_11811/g.19957 Transcript_11811/m.19957 type:complete len:495 (+) Transcript_11811:782-2266(+)